ncbi:Retinoblastoma-like protein 2 [Liparis tanakae]|uniref:Retinoblastoma-like protein 2 n=1 Tax=Liparis tanakae TaxID=230148 RepID=A0A4Z2E8N0_9TELE|nr:Retinoblastoma-like protein 2 [Liparis tanakae]
MARRLQELSSSLSVSTELRLKVWTCLEFSLVHRTDLMADRHLDQLLMCAVYIMAKVTRVEIPFRRIMKCYRSQPLVNDNVCNNVLMSNAVHHHNGAAPPTPDTPSTRYPEAPGRETGSLIHFYNRIYTTRMQRFAERFSPTAAVRGAFCGGRHGGQRAVLTLTLSAGALASFVSVPPAAEGVVWATAAVRLLPRLRLTSRHRRRRRPRRPRRPRPQDRRAELLLQLQPPRGLQTGRWKRIVVSSHGILK